MRKETQYKDFLLFLYKISELMTYEEKKEL